MKKYILISSLLLVPFVSIAQEKDDAFTETYRSAFISYKNNQLSDSKAHLEKADKLKPEDPKVKILKGRIALEEGDYSSAEKLISQALPPDGTADPAYQYLGDVYFRERNYQKARDAYSNFLRAKPKDADGLLKIVYSSIANNKMDEARSYANQLDAFSDLHPGYYLAKSALARSAGKLDEAEKFIQKARTLYGNQVVAENLKNYLQIFSGNTKTDTTPTK